MYKHLNISYISTYIPRQCGIATFTNDLADSVTKLMGEKLSDGVTAQITAITNNSEGYKYSAEVKFEIKEQNLNDYREAAYYINLSPSEVVNLQHEFGIFGGEDGSNIITLIQNLNKPLVTTLHTVIGDPSEDQLKIIREIGNRSSYLVVQSVRALRMLERTYRIPKNKIVLIPHGAPDVPFLDPAYYKDKFHLSDRKVILTFGLLGPGKGIEDVILALSQVVKKHPKTTYIVLGATHPNVKKIYGEAYRNKLENMVKRYSIEDCVMFINRFVDNKQLLEFLLMSDIYVSPYHNKEQVVSGTLTYALACGNAVISTPYWHAEEVLKNNNIGMLVPFKNPPALADAIEELLDDETFRNRLRKNAYDSTRNMIWSKTAAGYCDIYQKALESYKKSPRIVLIKERFTGFPSIPDVNLNHLSNMTDTTGILQHATYSIPNRKEGYTLDDNSRALLVSLMNRDMFNNEPAMYLINIYLSYILYAYNEDTGLFRNFMNYERTWLEESGSEDSNANVIFVLGYLIKNPPNDSCLGIAKNLFDKVIDNTLRFSSPRAYALIIMGCIFYLSRFSGAREVRKICRTLADRLSGLYSANSDEKWKWFEQTATYNNGRLPQVMMMAGRFFKNKTFISQGIEALSWLYDVQYNRENKCISLIGNGGWLTKGRQKAKYDQQPVEIPALIDACYQAYKVTMDKEWVNKTGTVFSWFLGNNDRQEVLCDFITGGCYDGLSTSVINQNQGAESTISWLLSLHRMHRIRQDLQIK